MKSTYITLGMLLGTVAWADDSVGQLPRTTPPDHPAPDYPQKFGAGIIIGDPTGASLKLWLNDRLAVDGAVGWSSFDHSDLALHSDLLWHSFTLLPTPPAGQLPVYFGIGGQARLRDEHFDDEFGLRLPVGVSYLFDHAPVDIFVEVAPIIEMTPEIRGGLTAAIGVRYWF